MTVVVGQRKRVLIIGGGFCGLAAAVELGKKGVPLVLAEREREVGGLSRTATVLGKKFELGPHIYFDRDPEVTAYWRELVGSKLRSYLRNNRLYYNGKYIKSPLSVVDATIKLGPITVATIVLSYLQSKLRSSPINSAEDWVVANFGSQLYERFFKVYNEKIWGLKASDITPDWAGQRIKSSLVSMVTRSVLRDEKFIIKTFDFPTGGSQVICAAQERLIRSHPNSDLRLDTSVAQIDKTPAGFLVRFSEQSAPEEFSDVICTTHLGDLVECIHYPGKDDKRLRELCSKLLYRNLVLVNLVFDREQTQNFSEHWIDVHDPEVTALRVTNFSNYDFFEDDESRSAIGLEYNCFAEDAIWTMSDADAVAVALRDLARMKIVDAKPRGFCVLRLPMAYPVYFKGYQAVTQALVGELAKVAGLVLAGRNAMYKWNNMHHSVKTGLLAARIVMGEKHDLTQVKGMVAIGKDSD